LQAPSPSHPVRVRAPSLWVPDLLLSSCDLHTGEVKFSGTTTWLNPHGYLPAELYPFLPFYGVLTVVYVLMSLAWAATCARYWSQVTFMQATTRERRARKSASPLKTTPP